MTALRIKRFSGWACDCASFPHAPLYCEHRRPITTEITVDDDFRVPPLTDAQRAYRAKKDRERGRSCAPDVSGVDGAESPRRAPIIACRIATAEELPPDAARWLAILWRLRRPAVCTYAKGWGTKRFKYPPGTKDAQGKVMHWHDDPWPIESVALRAPGLLVACWTRLEGASKWSPSTRMAIWKGRIYRIDVNQANRLITGLAPMSTSPGSAAR